MATPVTYGIGAVSDIYLALIFTERNAKGPRLVWDLPNCKLDQKKALDLISDKYTSLPFDVKVLSYFDDRFLGEDGQPLQIFGTVTHPDKDKIAPLIGNYKIPSGVLKIKRLDLEAEYRHAGNCSDIKLKFDFKGIEHKQFMDGAASVDDETTVERAMSLDAMLDENTATNVRDVVYGMELV